MEQQLHYFYILNTWGNYIKVGVTNSNNIKNRFRGYCTYISGFGLDNIKLLIQLQKKEHSQFLEHQLKKLAKQYINEHGGGQHNREHFWSHDYAEFLQYLKDQALEISKALILNDD